MNDTLSLAELDDRIAILRDNLRHKRQEHPAAKTRRGPRTASLNKQTNLIGSF